MDAVLEVVTTADARARFSQALANTSAEVEQSADWEQWPMLRPFVEFVVGRMPEGGTGYDENDLLSGPLGASLTTPERPPWILEDGTDLVQEFTVSEHAADLKPGKAVEDLAAYLMILLDASFGDPLGWDPELAEWILSEVLPTVPMLSKAAVAQIPAALPALVGWSLERKGEEPSVIAQTLSALAPLLEEFPARRADPHMRARRLEEQVDYALELEDSTALRLADLALRAGGFEALAELDTTPLPTEELALALFPEELRGLAAEIDAHLVEGVTALLEQRPGSAESDELLTACRRLLVRVAQLDDAVLRRKASTRNTAAAVVSIIARGNDLMGYSPAPLHEKDLRRPRIVGLCPESVEVLLEDKAGGGEALRLEEGVSVGVERPRIEPEGAGADAACPVGDALHQNFANALTAGSFVDRDVMNVDRCVAELEGGLGPRQNFGQQVPHRRRPVILRDKEDGIIREACDQEVTQRTHLGRAEEVRPALGVDRLDLGRKEGQRIDVAESRRTQFDALILHPQSVAPDPRGLMRG